MFVKILITYITFFFFNYNCFFMSNAIPKMQSLLSPIIILTQMLTIPRNSKKNSKS